jgi:hypothetical protein
MLDVSQHVKLELLGTCTDYLCEGIYSKDCEALRKMRGMDLSHTYQCLKETPIY